MTQPSPEAVEAVTRIVQQALQGVTEPLVARLERLEQVLTEDRSQTTPTTPTGLKLARPGMLPVGQTSSVHQATTYLCTMEQRGLSQSECTYRHICLSCHGSHREVNCAGATAATSRETTTTARGKPPFRKEAGQAAKTLTRAPMHTSPHMSAHTPINQFSLSCSTSYLNNDICDDFSYISNESCIMCCEAYDQCACWQGTIEELVAYESSEERPPGIRGMHQ